MTTQTASTGVTPRQGCPAAQHVTRSLLGYGVLAGAVFEASILIQGLTRHGFLRARPTATARFSSMTGDGASSRPAPRPAWRLVRGHRGADCPARHGHGIPPGPRHDIHGHPAADGARRARTGPDAWRAGNPGASRA